MAIEPEQKTSPSEWRISTITSIVSSLIQCRIAVSEAESRLLYRKQSTQQLLFSLRNPFLVTRFTNRIRRNCIDQHIALLGDTVKQPTIITASRTFDDPDAMPSLTTDSFYYNCIQREERPLPLFCALYPAIKRGPTKLVFASMNWHSWIENVQKREDQHLHINQRNPMLGNPCFLGTLFSILCTDTISQFSSRPEAYSNAPFEKLSEHDPVVAFLRASIESLQLWFSSKNPEPFDAEVNDDFVERFTRVALQIVSFKKKVIPMIRNIEARAGFMDLSERYDRHSREEEHIFTPLPGVRFILPILNLAEDTVIRSPNITLEYSFHGGIFDSEIDYRRKYAESLSEIGLIPQGSIREVSRNIMQYAALMDLFTDEQLKTIATRTENVSRGIMRYCRFLAVIAKEMSADLLLASL